MQVSQPFTHNGDAKFEARLQNPSLQIAFEKFPSLSTPTTVTSFDTQTGEQLHTYYYEVLLETVATQYDTLECSSLQFTSLEEFSSTMYHMFGVHIDVPQTVPTSGTFKHIHGLFGTPATTNWQLSQSLQYL